MKVVGAGLGRTGTLSLKFALERLLDARCYHMMEVGAAGHVDAWYRAATGESVDWQALLGDFDAIVDWPGAAFWEQLSNAFPDALVLLSHRPLDRWYESASSTILPDTDNDGSTEALEFERMWHAIRNEFTPNWADRDVTIEAARRHNERVVNTVPADRLLVYEPGDGWGPICDRLGIPVPDEPYPHVNTREQFLRRREQNRAERNPG
ncbi:MAG: sulfotransferase family protein [Acidimicrobiales bacterium]